MSDRAQRPYLSAPDRAELPALTGVRAVAAIWVTGWHASGLAGGLLFPFTHGYLGVDLFFILSGFIIAYVYWQEFEQRFSGRAYGRFIALRLARLWPAHVAVLLVFCGLALGWTLAAGQTPPAVFWREVVAQLLLIHNWGAVEHITINIPSWSVSAEFLAYLLFPLYVVLFRRLRSPWVLLAAIAVAMALCILPAAFVSRWPFNDPGPLSNIRVACEFAIGVALFRLWQGGRVASAPWSAIVLLALAGILAITALTPPRHRLDYAIVLLMAPLILGLAQSGGLLVRLLSSRAMVYLGEISYSTYLVHGLVIVLLEKTVRRSDFLQSLKDADGLSVLLPAAIALSLLGGALLFHIVEKPARHWLRRRIDRRWPDSV